MALSRIERENERLQNLQYKIDLRNLRAAGRRELPDRKEFNVLEDEKKNFIPPTEEKTIFTSNRQDYINDHPFNTHDVKHIFKLIQNKFKTKASHLIWKDRHNNIHTQPAFQKTKVPSRIIINFPKYNKLIFYINKHLYILSFKTDPNETSIEPQYNIKFDVHADEINSICELALNTFNLFENSRVSKHIITGSHRFQRKRRLWYMLWFMTKGRVPSCLDDDKIKKRCESLLPFNNDGRQVQYKNRNTVMNETINTLFSRN